MATFEPYYASENQRLYTFPNGHGASVVKRRDGHEVAVISVQPPAKQFWLNYRTDFGQPRQVGDNTEVENALTEIAALPNAEHKLGEKP